MRVVFAGSAALACPALKALLCSERHSVAGVITQPDRPRGRSLLVSPCAVGAFVKDANMPVLTPENINSSGSLEAIRGLSPDLVVVIAYGQFLKSELLELPPKGCLNLHASLLPAYRGAAPIQWAIANGEQETGATVMYINERMDAGDIVLQSRMPIADGDDAGSLHDRLAEAGAGLMLEALDAVEAGTAVRIPQDESLASLAPKLKKSNGRIDWSRPARELYNHVRGFHPWPGCYCRFRNEKGVDTYLKILRTRVEPGAGAPGTVLDTGKEGLLAATGDCALRLLHVQPEGRRRMTGADFLHGYKLKEGDVLL